MKRAYMILVALALMTLVIADASAQVATDRFQVVLQAGWQTYAGGSGLNSGPTVAGDATYFFGSRIGVGVWSDLTIAESAGDKFTPAAFSFVDSTTFHTINQSVDIWHYGLHAKLQLAGRTAPFLLAGAGGYRLFLDPQQNSGNSSTTGFVLRFGVGIDVAIGEAVGLELALADIFYPDWDPSALLPTQEDFRNTRFPELNPDPGELSQSVHNFKFVVGLTLVTSL
jgi:hypothetical protein